MKRKLVGFVVLLMTSAMVFTACGQKEAVEQSEQTEAADVSEAGEGDTDMAAAQNVAELIEAIQVVILLKQRPP